MPALKIAQNKAQSRVDAPGPEVYTPPLAPTAGGRSGGKIQIE